MTTLHKHIKELIQFYIKTNYEQYLKDNQLDYIKTEDIPQVIESLYEVRKTHIKEFVKNSLQQLLTKEYPGDLVVTRLLDEIFSDDEFCKNRLVTEITLHQHERLNINTDYRKI